MEKDRRPSRPRENQDEEKPEKSTSMTKDERRTENALLLDELCRLKERHNEELVLRSNDLEAKKRQMAIYIEGLQREKSSLLRRIQDQAVTIHELSLNEPEPQLMAVKNSTPVYSPSQEYSASPTSVKTQLRERSLGDLSR